MRIAVTGAAGRLGRYVVARAVRAGHEVIASELPGAVGAADGPVVWRSADLTVLDEGRAALVGADALVDLGALAHPRYPEPEVHRVNVGGTHNVLVAAEEHDLRAVCLASSINAIGGIYSAAASFDYFPVDEDHPTYCEDSYSTSKWILEQESAAFARRRPDVAFSALRLHGLRTHRAAGPDGDEGQRARDLWGWTSFDAAAAACLLAVARPTPGHAVYNVVAARTTSETPTEELTRKWYPDVPLRAPLPDDASFYSSAKARAELGWDPVVEHPEVAAAERG